MVNEKRLMAWVLGSLGVVLTGCQGPQRAVGIQKVDSLVSRVERVHYDTELAVEGASDAVLALRQIVQHNFDGPAVDAYADFIQKLELSETRTDRLRNGVDPMDRAAGEVYERWTSDLEAFNSPSMRYRSQVRRDQTVLRYAELKETINPTLAALDGFNLALRDHALFLSNDLNTSSVEILEPELDGLRVNLTLLEDVATTTMDAAREYVKSSAPLGQVGEVSEREIESSGDDDDQDR